MTTTTCLPADSSRAATCSAAHSAAPQEMPASTPTRRATSRAVEIASSSETVMTSSRSSRLSTGGMKPAPIPWMRCGPMRPPERTADPAGSTPTIRRRGLRVRRYSPAPVIVPPVPTPATSTSTRPSSARSISGPVVRRWASGLAGLENWSGRNTSSSFAIARAASTASAMPPSDSVMSTRAPYMRSRLSRSWLIPCGSVSTSR